MSAFLPPPVPLRMPPGHPDGIGDLAHAVAGAAFGLVLLDGHLAGPAAWAPGWLGDDAAAAAAQLARLLALVRDDAAALDRAAGRLAGHRELLESTRAFVAALAEQQEADFAAAEQQLASLVEHAAQVSSVSLDPRARAVVEQLEATEERRRRQHAAVLEEVTADAALTAAVLAEATRVVAGTAAHRDGTGVIAHLAALLPGWGDAELATRGRALAGTLRASGSEAWEAAARDAAVLAGQPAFADALLQRLGVGGLRDVLLLLGKRTFDDDLAGRSSAVAGLVATALGATTAGPGGPGRVLRGTYVDADADGIDPDYVAMGMAVVLTAGVPSGGTAPMTVASWTRQVLARERRLAGDPAGSRAVDRVYPNARHDAATDDASFRRFDPVPVLVDWLAEHGTARAAASALAERDHWTLLLDRSWDDGGAALSDVVSLAADHPGAAGARAARSGLAAVGAGLFEGDPTDWTVDREVVAVVAPALGQAVAGHVTVATAALAEVAGGEMADGTEDVVRGLGHLTVDRVAADTVTGALTHWALGQSHDLAGTSAASPLPAIAVPSVFVAVQQYGQWLDHALDGYEAKEGAELRQRTWDATVGLLVGLVPGPWGIAAGVLEGYAAIALDMDGTWENGPDPGVVMDARDAGRAAVAGLGPAPAPEAAPDAAAVAGQARASYERAIDLLGRPMAPTSPDEDYLAPLTDGLTDVTRDRVSDDPRMPRWTRNPLVSLVR
jgi:hypothetical protein